MVVDSSEAKDMSDDEDEKPSSWRGKLTWWISRYLPVKY